MAVVCRRCLVSTLISPVVRHPATSLSGFPRNRTRRDGVARAQTLYSFHISPAYPSPQKLGCASGSLAITHQPYCHIGDSDRERPPSGRHCCSAFMGVKCVTIRPRHLNTSSSTPASTKVAQIGSTRRALQIQTLQPQNPSGDPHESSPPPPPSVPGTAGTGETCCIIVTGCDGGQAYVGCAGGSEKCDSQTTTPGTCKP